MMTPAQKRDIFYRAAAYIEAHPEMYNFAAVRVPEIGVCGCMWGHVGRLVGMSEEEHYVNEVAYAFGLNDDDLYIFGGPERLYLHDPAYAARLMRAFADHHWPAPVKPVAMRFPELMRSLGAEVV